VAMDVVEMVKASVNLLSINARTLAADTKKTMALSRNSCARAIHKVHIALIPCSRELFG